ncbi:MAG TPA: DNA-3-methyladenine glycosylase I [Edaphocola sp.]|nr:DNA-3-methyladenine glycosylase I [Edaphocola sp.]
MATAEIARCGWPGADPMMIDYHDREWGVPLHDDQKLFEYMVLDAFQAGLSWKTILHRREGFRKAFARFDPQKVARFPDKKIEMLMQDTGIIRNRLKIQATVSNARLFLDVQKEFGSFDRYIWQFTEGKTIQNHRKQNEPPVATSPQSDKMSKDLKERGFRFVGSTICYAFMQAAGMVNDHHSGCFRYHELL